MKLGWWTVGLCITSETIAKNLDTRGINKGRSLRETFAENSNAMCFVRGLALSAVCIS